MKKDVIIKCSGSRLHTAWRIVNMYNWFQRDWEAHTSVEQVKIQAGIITRKASYLRMVASQMPRIGWKLSGRVAKHFGSIDRMINSLPSEWEQIEGIGRNTALEICKVIKEDLGR
jgi:ERCC4-type nuclease